MAEADTESVYVKMACACGHEEDWPRACVGKYPTDHLCWDCVDKQRAREHAASRARQVARRIARQARVVPDPGPRYTYNASGRGTPSITATRDADADGYDVECAKQLIRELYPYFGYAPPEHILVADTPTQGQVLIRQPKDHRFFAQKQVRAGGLTEDTQGRASLCSIIRGALKHPSLVWWAEDATAHGRDGARLLTPSPGAYASIPVTYGQFGEWHPQNITTRVQEICFELAHLVCTWWAYEGLAVVTRRPSEVHLDSDGLLHNAVGPALVFESTGTGDARTRRYYVVHGLEVPRLVTRPSQIKVADILQSTNTTIQRFLLEAYGLDRFVGDLLGNPEQDKGKGAPAEVLDEDLDSSGMPRRLIAIRTRARYPDDEMLLVQVQDPSTHHTYFLRVPPRETGDWWAAGRETKRTVGIQTCKEAVAWTYGFVGVDMSRYSPAQEA